MSDLSSIEKLKLEKAFQMEGGYVLDFSNPKFQTFVHENANVDIFDQRYDYNSGSKANRMRAFWLKDSNESVGRLIDKLIEYWREKSLIDNRPVTLQEDEILKGCSKIALRLKGEVVSTSKAQPIKTSFLENKRKILQRYDEFGMISDPAERRRRGNKLELLVQDAFDLYKIQTRNRFTRNDGGEQIDGAFILDGWFYIVECKWVEKLSDIRQLDSLYGKLSRSGKQTMGVFLSINGWSDNVIPLLKQNQDKSILLMDGYDLRCILDENVNVSLIELLKSKLSHFNFEGDPFYSVMTHMGDKKGR